MELSKNNSDFESVKENCSELQVNGIHELVEKEDQGAAVKEEMKTAEMDALGSANDNETKLSSIDGSDSVIEDRRTEKRIVGDEGEEICCKYLSNRGYKIVARNFSCKLGEIDVIVQKDEYICFVEVKSRNSIECGLPCEAVNSEKQNNIKHTAEYFIMTNPIYSKSQCRFDIFEVLRLEGKRYVRFLENAFQ